MAYSTRYLNKSELTGYLVKQFNLCGKKNCRCARDGKGHEANYVYYREYVLKPGVVTRSGLVSKLRKKYIKKSELEEWRRTLASNKSYFIGKRIPIDALDDKKLSKLKGKELRMALFEKYRVKRTKGALQVFPSQKHLKFLEEQQLIKNRYLRLRHELRLLHIKTCVDPFLPSNWNNLDISKIISAFSNTSKLYADKHN